MKNKNFIIFIIAFLIRVIAAIVFIILNPEWPTGSSSIYRLGLAESIAQGNGFSFNSIPNIYQTPIYPFFISVLINFFGNTWWIIAVGQSILEGITSVWISKIGANVAKSGWYSGFIYALFPFSILQSRSIVDTTLFTFLFIGSAYYLICFYKHSDLKYLIIGSILVSIGFLNRPSILPILVSFLLIYFINREITVKNKMKILMISTILFISFPGIWSYRNYKLINEFPVISVAGDHFLWFSHNNHTQKIMLRKESPDLIGVDERYQMNPNIKVSSFFKISPIEQFELGELCKQQYLTWISLNKIQFIKNIINKLISFVSWNYTLQSVDNKFQKLRIMVYKIWSIPITILGWIGISLLLYRRSTFGKYIFLIVSGFILIHSISQFGSRHKVPMDALFISLIPFTLEWIYSKLNLIKERFAS